MNRIRRPELLGLPKQPYSLAGCAIAIEIRVPPNVWSERRQRAQGPLLPPLRPRLALFH